MNDAFIDALFDNLPEKQEPVPFYVIVHEDVMEQQSSLLDSRAVAQTRQEIATIKTYHEFVNSGPFVIQPNIPRFRPVYVCGAFLEACVQEQYNRLKEAGYDVHLSNSGNLSIFACK